MVYDAEPQARKKDIQEELVEVFDCGINTDNK